jgi:RNA polymerase sigma-32 factor
MFNLSVNTFNLQDIKQLSLEEEHELAISYFEYKDKEAAHKLAVAHLPLVVKVAWRYAHYFQVYVEDLIQEGMVGLMKAIRVFNPYAGSRLASFAYKWIRKEMKLFIMQTWSLVKIGTTTEERNTFFKAIDISKEKEEGDTEEIKALAVRIKQRDYYLSTTFNEDTEDTFIDLVKDSGKNPEELLSNQLLQELILKALNMLTEKEKSIIEKRYLKGNVSLQSIASFMNISKQRVNELEKRALKKIKNFLIESEVF